MFCNVVLGLLPVAFMCATSAAVALVSGAPAIAQDGPVGLFLGLALAALLLTGGLSPVQAMLGDRVARRVDNACSDRLMKACLDAPYEMLERPKTLDTLSDAHVGLESRTSTPGAAVAGTIALIARYTQLAAAVVALVVTLGPLAGLVAVATAAAARHGNRGALRRWSWLSGQFLPARRRYRYVHGVASDPAAGKEIRGLAILPWLTRRADTESDALLAPVWRHRHAVYLWPFIVLTAVLMAGSAVFMVLLVRSVTEGPVSPFALALAVQSLLVPLLFGVFFAESDVQTQLGSMSFACITELEDRFAEAGGRTTSAGGRRIDDPGDLRLEGVHFRYPGQERDVLRGIDVTFPAGSSTAIVGLNGAGKTTLIKLLVKLYEPTAGRVTAGGMDLSDVDIQAWHRQMAVVFQDFTRYQLDAATNIQLGAPHRAGDTASVLAAATAAGILPVLQGLPDGLRTPLASRYAGGVDLSGGQWQRVALARAVYAMEGGASVLILDEPTAQLDVRSEAAFYDNFLNLTAGRTTIIISHRFSTLRRADRILVLADGRVVESGSHDELLRSGGRYAQMYRLQSDPLAGEYVPAREST
ncbi:MAG: ATP-binding cassette domain-containing protein [Umezawaea sp.]